MRVSGRAIVAGAALLTCLVGGAGAAEDKGSAGANGTGAPAHGPAGASTGSVGAGGLTGSAATSDGARTGTPDKNRPAGSSTPAPGTTR